MNEKLAELETFDPEDYIRNVIKRSLVALFFLRCCTKFTVRPSFHLLILGWPFRSDERVLCTAICEPKVAEKIRAI